MATTTIRFEDELKVRVAAAAEIAGKTTHAFILDAIAERRWAKIVATGKTVPWEATKEHLVARARAKSPRRPAARKTDL